VQPEPLRAHLFELIANMTPFASQSEEDKEISTTGTVDDAPTNVVPTRSSSVRSLTIIMPTAPCACSTATFSATTSPTALSSVASSSGFLAYIATMRPARSAPFCISLVFQRDSAH
jgi:hypothetical protein